MCPQAESNRYLHLRRALCFHYTMRIKGRTRIRTGVSRVKVLRDDRLHYTTDNHKTRLTSEQTMRGVGFEPTSA